MKLPLAFMLGCALLLPPVVRASSFEGTVEMKMTSGNQAASKMDFHIKAGCSRIDIEREGAPAASVIMDRADSRMIFLMPAQRMYLIRPWPMAAGTNPAMGRSGGGEGKGASLQVTTSREKILGYDTVKYVVTSKVGTTELWATEQLGSFMGFAPGNPMGGPSRPSAGWEKALRGKNLFPLRVVLRRGGKEVFRMEAVSVRKESLPAGTFEPPAGYRDIGSMMPGGMMPAGGGAPGM